MIEPTVGRIVWYRPWGAAKDAEQPLAAKIAHVNTDGSINIGYLDAEGSPLSASNIPLIQDGDDRPGHAFCEWMPFQKSQQAKADAAAVDQQAKTAKPKPSKPADTVVSNEAPPAEPTPSAPDASTAT